MLARRISVMDGNEAVASVAHRVNEFIAAYPIVPSSRIGQLAREWSSKGRPNIWGAVPQVMEMRSEAGAARTIHGALQAGALATTFTASQGLLFMLPSMYKIAGELTSFAMHVAARTVATHAISVFGDHSDVMAARQTGFALLCSNSVQEAHDFTAIAQAATLTSRVPFLHFFDGFRTSHEVATVEVLDDDDLRRLITDEMVASHRARALTPERPVLRGTAQNPDVFFQAREACNEFYRLCPDVVQATMDDFAFVTGRRYELFEYAGDPQAERVLLVMGSGAETAHETVDRLVRRGERVGVLKTRLFRPFSVNHFLAALPASVRAVAVLDRTKEPGAVGEPLYLDVMAALGEANIRSLVIGGRYGLASKEFTPAMVKVVLDELSRAEPRRHFTVGIKDDVTHLSLRIDPSAGGDLESGDEATVLMYGLETDGTADAARRAVEIASEEEGSYAQAYSVPDAGQPGGVIVSHLRFGTHPIRSAYLIRRAGFVACHQWGFLEKYDVLEPAAPGSVFLLNSPFGKGTFDKLPREVQAQILEKGLRLHAIDARSIAAENGLGARIDTIMLACFLALSDVLPREKALERMKRNIERSCGEGGGEAAKRNERAVDGALSRLEGVPVLGRLAGEPRSPVVSEATPDFVNRVTALMLAGKGSLLPVSAFPVDGAWPAGMARFAKRPVAAELPIWDPDLCIQCNRCALICPHAAIRAKFYPAEALASAPPTFKSVEFKSALAKGAMYTVQVVPEECTGCNVCVEICPAQSKSEPRRKALAMAPMLALRAREVENFQFFQSLPQADRTQLRLDAAGTQFLEPLFEFSGACPGCGQTAYVRLITQLYGDRVLVANAAGCPSVYGGSLPSTPACRNAEGRGPAWANSPFEDNAEFGLGMRLAVDKQARFARDLVRGLAAPVGEELVSALLRAEQSTEAGIAQQRDRVKVLRERLGPLARPGARRLEVLADYLIRRSIWIMGGDGWAYDIGYGGLDRVFACGRDVNVLVLDTEVDANSARGGTGKERKDLALLAMTYGNVFVATVALGAEDAQAVRAIREADSYPGTSLVIAYAHCARQAAEAQGLDRQVLAVASGRWPLFRFDPRCAAAGVDPLQLDAPLPSVRSLDVRLPEDGRVAKAARSPEELKALARERYRVIEEMAAGKQTLPSGEAIASSAAPSRNGNPK